MIEHSDSTGQQIPQVRSRRIAGIVSVIAALIVASPVVENWKSRPEDGFPLSHYPMFTAERGDTMRVNYIVGYTGEGERRLIRYRHAGTGGLNQVRRQINVRVRRGEADRLCESVESSLVRSSRRSDEEIVKLQIVAGTYAFDEYFNGRREPRKEAVHAACAVERSGS